MTMNKFEKSTLEVCATRPAPTVLSSFLHYARALYLRLSRLELVSLPYTTYLRSTLYGLGFTRDTTRLTHYALIRLYRSTYKFISVV